MFFLCAHPTITIREHRLDRFTEVRKTFQGKIIISIGWLHSFQGLFYIVLTLGGLFCCNGSSLRLVLGHSRITPQNVFLRGLVVTKTPISTERVVYLT